MPAVLALPAAPMVICAHPGRGDAPKGPTLASAWQAVTGTTIGDELLEWPPDVFALTEVILQRSDAYRFALSPPAGLTWPPASFPDWPDAVAAAARRWSSWAEDRNQAIPGLVAQEWAVLRERAESPLDDLTQARDWRLCQALLTLHAIADEACAGLGIALDASSADGLLYRARGRELLGRRPGGSGREFSGVSVQQVTAARTGTGSRHSLAGSPSRPALAAEEATILASWAQAAAEALTFGSERIEAVIADARAGAPWRAELGIRQPSSPLQHSISGMFHAVYPGAAASGDPPTGCSTPSRCRDLPPGPRRRCVGSGVQPGRACSARAGGRE